MKTKIMLESKRQRRLSWILLQMIEDIDTRFVNEAIAEWDSCGEGSFKEFIKWRVKEKWGELGMSN